MFAVYLRLGFEHLLDLQGYDHILFIAALCAAYALSQWRELLVLVTAFTVGHSLSLAMATLGWIRVDTGLVEFLIPVTIVAAAVINLVAPPSAAEGGDEAGARSDRRTRRLKYGTALAFGLIHGLGFSNFLRLMLGGEVGIFVPLLSFNVGLELAQIVVALATLTAAFLATRFLGVPTRVWNGALSALVGVVAAWMAAGRWPL